MGVANPHGCFAERVAVHYKHVFRVPDQITDLAGAMIEPTAVAVHVNNRGGVSKGARVVVIGGGVIGLLCAQVARARGASKVLISEPIFERRKLAERLGFDLVFDPMRSNIIQNIRDSMGSADVVMDVVGTRETLSIATECLRPEGCLVLVAFPHEPDMAVPYFHIMLKELRVFGSRLYFVSDFHEAMALIENGKVDPAPLINGIFPLHECARAIRLLEKEPAQYVKILLSVETT
jgi:2-desacetyl-2-hydroxyethyl bacteriochlorophyllide A dehydrogenase